MTLEEVTQFVEAKEAGKRSASRLLDTHSIAATSSYKKTKQPKDKNKTCSYCGKKATADMHQVVPVKQNVLPLVTSVDIATRTTT